MFKKVIGIHGVPRSGTTWLGQIVDSNPNVEYRFQPLFSYAFKDYLKPSSKKEDFIVFLEKIYDSQDDFLLQRENKKMGHYPGFEKIKEPSVLAFKMVRYHYLIPQFLEFVLLYKGVGIIRHPCAVLNSWFNQPREFPENGDPMKEWRFGKIRNRKPEEYWGYEKWKEVAGLFMELEESHPKRFKIIVYEELVEQPMKKTEEIYRFLDLEMTKQTREFIQKCHSRHDEHVDAVFKSKKVKNKWKNQLDERIKQKVIEDLANTKFGNFWE